MLHPVSIYVDREIQQKGYKQQIRLGIFVFQAGNIIITGAKNKSHVIDSYKYINDIFVTHSDYIIKKDQDEEGKKRAKEKYTFFRCSTFEKKPFLVSFEN